MLQIYLFVTLKSDKFRASFFKKCSISITVFFEWYFDEIIHEYIIISFYVYLALDLLFLLSYDFVML